MSTSETLQRPTDPAHGACGCASTCAALQPARTLRVPDMCCKNEEKPIRLALENLAGVKALNVDLPEHTITFQASDAAWAEAVAAVNKLGFATEPALPAAAGDCCGSACAAPIALAPPMRKEEPLSKAAPSSDGALMLRIPEMDCASEEGQIRRALEGFPQVKRLRFDLPARLLSVDVPAQTWGAVVAAIAKLGFTPEQLSAPPAAEDTAKAQRVELARLLAALGVAVLAEVLHLVFPDTLPWRVAGMAVAGGAIALSGLTVFKKGLSSLLRGQLNINALMSAAVVGAFLIGQWPEAAMVMALYSLAELIEARSVERARNAIAGLLALSPSRAEIRQPDGTWVSTQASEIAVGAVARVKPGERIALDGRVTSGHGAVDQSPVTGESIPVDKVPGDDVFAGTINQSGALEFEVTKPASDTVLARIIHAVEEAQSQRAPTQRIVDKFAAIYTPAVFVLAVAVAVGMPLVAGWPWLEAVYKALVLLVIACPCALVISTPVTVVSGLAAAARRGILIKGGVYLEQARKLTVLGLDKTGTLTEGKPKLVAHRVLASDVADDRARLIALSLAERSDHPVSRAVAAGLKGSAVEVQDFGAELGRGVHGSLDGRKYILGNHRWLHERGLCSPEIEALMKEHEAQGRTLSVLADDDRALGKVCVNGASMC